MLEDFTPTIPDWAQDQHTIKDKAMGRGLDHPRKAGAKLIPPPPGGDPFPGRSISRRSGTRIGVPRALASGMVLDLLQ
ncbi:hypothetical protein [Bradyrhizobium sp. 33ap4]|uniref:hypothetical protein n=1 Tax=Bradyrhizobium sp. 33ap4 TaxID=3061630 RepID=UPI0029317F14|nr:hypothetical protein [Bradyrhizobium sp. 33ap4]